MVEIVTAQHPALLAWAAERLDIPFDPSRCRWLAGVEGERIVWVVVYSDFARRGCQLSIFTDGTRTWATRRALNAIFSTVFLQWQLHRCTFLVRADNIASLQLVRRLGAQQEGVLREASEGNVDMIVFGMLYSEAAKWLRQQ